MWKGEGTWSVEKQCGRLWRGAREGGEGRVHCVVLTDAGGNEMCRGKRCVGGEHRSVTIASSLDHREAGVKAHLNAANTHFNVTQLVFEWVKMRHFVAECMYVCVCVCVCEWVEWASQY